MIQYKNWAPTQFDSKGLNADEYGIGDFYVLPILHQPKLSGQLLNKANFDSALKILGGESEKVQVLYFGHWTSNLEIIVVHPELIDKVQEIENLLSDYPVLNDEYYSKLEYEALTELWNNTFDYQDRKDFVIKYNKRYDASYSLNQAKRKYYNLCYEIQDYFRDIYCNEL